MKPDITPTTPHRPGFTLVEILTSIAVIFMLLALLLGAVKFAGRTAKNVQQTVTVGTIRDAIATFERDFGFPPPLVKEKAGLGLPGPATPEPGTAAWNPGTVIEQVPASNPPRNRISVYFDEDLSPNSPDVPLHGNDARFLRNRGNIAAPPSPTNPFFDLRFSERTFAFYLCGLCNEPFFTGNTVLNVPVDGQNGAGLYTPRADGSFQVPSKLLVTGVTRRKFTGRVTSPFMDVGRSDPRVFTDLATPTLWVEMRDRNNVAYRYYRWKSALPTDPGYVATATLANLRIPRLIGEDPTTAIGPVPPSRDLAVNTGLRSASWAVVGPGRDGVFGDEPFEYLKLKGNYSSSMSEVVMRYEAAKDNIVEVGQ